MAVGAYGTAGTRHGGPMTHPVLDMQRAMNGGGIAEPGPGGLFTEFGEFIDNTPRYAAGIVLASAIVLFLLKRAGFRFNFGVGANVGR